MVSGRRHRLRAKVFSCLRGLLTYGSPLDKFAAIWPARVPNNRGEPVFSKDTEWINIYDSTDPVAGNLDAFGQWPAEPGQLAPKNFGY